MFITLTQLSHGKFIPTTIAVKHICMYHDQKDEGLFESTSRENYPDFPEVRTLLMLTYSWIEVLESPAEIKKRIRVAR